MDLFGRLSSMKKKDPIKFAIIDALHEHDNLTLALLLPQLQDVNVVDPSGSTLLMLALWAKNDVAIDMLISHGASLNVENKYADCMTPLGIAASLNHTGYTELLLDAGADPNYENSLGQRPLDFARECASHEIYQLLISRGAQA